VITTASPMLLLFKWEAHKEVFSRHYYLPALLMTSVNVFNIAISTLNAANDIDAAIGLVNADLERIRQ
jgi:hypothetical protein